MEIGRHLDHPVWLLCTPAASTQSMSTHLVPQALRRVTAILMVPQSPRPALHLVPQAPRPAVALRPPSLSLPLVYGSMYTYIYIYIYKIYIYIYVYTYVSTSQRRP